MLNNKQGVLLTNQKTKRYIIIGTNTQKIECKKNPYFLQKGLENVQRQLMKTRKLIQRVKIKSKEKQPRSCGDNLNIESIICRHTTKDGRNIAKVAI